MKLDFLKETVSEDRIENGAWLHFTHPVSGEPLYLDPGKNTQPSRALVRSVRSKVFRDKHDSLMSRHSAKLARARGKEKDKVTETEGRLERPRKAAVLVAELENVSREAPGRQPAPTEDDWIAINDDSTLQWMIEQVFNFASEDENYGGAAAVAAVGNAAAETGADKS